MVGVGLLVAITFIARMIQPLNYPGHPFIQTGLFYDKICALGSYEMIVCPYTAPPYETLISILAIVLVVLVWAYSRKK